LRHLGFSILGPAKSSSSERRRKEEERRAVALCLFRILEADADIPVSPI